MYGTAYSELLKVTIGGPAPLQRHFELAACAELFHVKVGCWPPLFVNLASGDELSCP